MYIQQQCDLYTLLTHIYIARHVCLYAHDCVMLCNIAVWSYVCKHACYMLCILHAIVVIVGRRSYIYYRQASGIRVILVERKEVSNGEWWLMSIPALSIPSFHIHSVHVVDIAAHNSVWGWGDVLVKPTHCPVWEIDVYIWHSACFVTNAGSVSNILG